MSIRRLPALVLIPAALVGLAIAQDDDRAADAPADVSTDVSVPAAQVVVGETTVALTGQPGVVMPVAYDTAALRSTWYCAGGTAVPDGIADHHVVITNPTERGVTAEVTVFAGALDGDPAAAALPPEPAVEVVDVGSHGRVEVAVAEILNAPFASALVEVAGGDVVVEHEVRGAGGPSIAPCATTAASHWFFAAGSTVRGAQELIALFNPFPDNAVVDIALATSDGLRQPAPYQGFVVPGGRVVVLDLQAIIARHESVSTSIVARTGRLVVDRIQLFDGTSTPASATVALGVPEPAEAWSFPDGQAADGVVESFVVYNPTDAPAEVDLDISLEDPAVNGEVDPVAVSIPAGSAVTVRLNDEQRVPLGVSHATTVESLNGVPVVAERQVVSGAPAPRRGVSFTVGSPLAARRWVLGAGAATAAVAEWVVLVNPSAETIATVSFTALAAGQGLAVDGLAGLEVPPGGRVAVEMGRHLNRDALSLLLVASRPIVVERGLFAADGNGFTQSIGIPQSGGTELLRPDA